MKTWKPEQIIALRKKLELTQEELARKLNTTFSTISRWENGWSEPSNMAVGLLEQLNKEKGHDREIGKQII